MLSSKVYKLFGECGDRCGDCFGWFRVGRYVFRDARFEVFGTEYVFTVVKPTEDVVLCIPDTYRNVVAYGFVDGVFVRVQYNDTRSGLEMYEIVFL